MSETIKPAGVDQKTELVNKWKLRLEQAVKNQKKIFDVAKENFEIYYAQTNDKQRAKSPWKSNVFLPLLPGKARDAKAKLSIVEPRFIVTPADSWVFNQETGELDFDQNALTKAMKVNKKLNKEFVNYTSTGELPPRAAVDYCTTDAIVAGWGLALAPLSTYKKTYKTHDTLKDANGIDSAYVDMKTTTTKSLLRVGTELEPLDIFRCYLSPKAKSWEKPRWVIIEREESYSDLEKANGGKGEKVYNLPAGLKDAKGTIVQNDYSAIRDVALGYNKDGSEYKDDTLELFNVYDCYDQENNMFYTFVNAKIEGSAQDWTCIREMDNPYNHGLIPIVPFYTKRRPHSPWGESFYEISKDIQYSYNSSFNQFNDNSTLSGETMALIDKNSIVGGYDLKPGGSVTYDSLNGEAPQPWKLTDPNPDILTTKMAILEKNAEGGMTPQYTSGQVDSSMDKTAGTKGGIEMLMEAANDKLSEMLRNMKCSLLRYGYIAMHNAQQYQNYIEVLDTPNMSTSGAKSIVNGEKVQANFITPADLQQAFDLDIDDESMLPMTKAERRRMYLDFVNTLVEFQAASIKQTELFDTPEDLLRIDWADVAKEVGNIFGELNAPAFIKKPITKTDLAEKKVEDAKVEQSATDEAAKIATENNPGAEVKQDPNGLTVQYQKRELGNIDKYPADVQNEAYVSLGYQPSALLDEKAKAQTAEAKSAQLDAGVKEQMIAAASNGQIDPETLAKFIKK